MDKITTSKKIFSMGFFLLLMAVSMIWTASPAGAVGPYFENESTARGQMQGPNPGWPRPDEPLWSPSHATLLSAQTFKKGDIILKNSMKSASAETVAPHVKEASGDQRVALR